VPRQISFFPAAALRQEAVAPVARCRVRACRVRACRGPARVPRQPHAPRQPRPGRPWAAPLLPANSSDGPSRSRVSIPKQPEFAAPPQRPFHPRLPGSCCVLTSAVRGGWAPAPRGWGAGATHPAAHPAVAVAPAGHTGRTPQSGQDSARRAADPGWDATVNRIHALRHAGKHLILKRLRSNSDGPPMPFAGGCGRVAGRARGRGRGRGGRGVRGMRCGTAGGRTQPAVDN
jgi:hypothetical protein